MVTKNIKFNMKGDTMEKTITIVAGCNMTLLINDQTYKTDENGILKINTNELLVSENRNLFEFDRLIMDYVGESQKTLFYELLIKCNRFGVGDVSQMLSIDKIQTKEILMLAFKNKLIRRYDTQWRVETSTKNEIQRFLLLKQKQEHLHETVPIFENHTLSSLSSLSPSPSIDQKKKAKKG